MRTALLLGRPCLRLGTRRAASIPRQQWRLFNLSRRSSFDSANSPLRKNTTLCAALSPAAFVLLSEEDNGDGKTPEEHMLEASRAEIEKRVPDNIHGLKRAWQGLYIFIDTWIYEPIATGVRFLHLVFIFVPVIVTVPSIWLGRRIKNRDNERAGTLWWYGFLVHSMERAGPAFIKVP